jgi:hypothetical protein
MIAGALARLLSRVRSSSEAKIPVLVIGVLQGQEGLSLSSVSTATAARAASLCVLLFSPFYLFLKVRDVLFRDAPIADK